MIIFIFILVQGLERDQTQMPSALLEKPLPDFVLSDLYAPNVQYDKTVFAGEMALVNIWASWCPPCAAEHNVITAIAQTGIPIYGLNYQDKRDKAKSWLLERGNPYRKIFFDERGSVGIDWGVIGVPETFLVDTQGIVRYRHIGEMTLAIWQNKFLPIIHTINPPQARSPYVFNHQKKRPGFFI